ncbi:MAG TPA: hypothetical protein VM936_20000 [Pyrinomonadaceae bacterium]|jgi:hypothetical protein|nr:hypothetical protein [Pyrinomonadaceae bacterium]
MSEQERRDDDARGDEVESAGETTAADTVNGPAHERPVGEGTEVEVEERSAFSTQPSA